MKICALLYQAKENLAIAASTKKPKPANRGLKEKYVLILKNVFIHCSPNIHFDLDPDIVYSCTINI